MGFQYIKIRQVPWEVLKTASSGLGFQHLPLDLANVNAWKTMFDPYIGNTVDLEQLMILGAWVSLFHTLNDVASTLLRRWINTMTMHWH